MGDEFLLWSVLGLAWLILLPTILIFIASWVVSKVVESSFYTHAALGFVGVPIHELSHAMACVLFRMPIIRMRLFAPDPETGNLGYVAFAYNPRSTFHAVGLLVQGVAPLIVASIILSLIPVPEQSLVYLGIEGNWLVNYTVDGINRGLMLTIGNLALGAEGCGWATIALLIAAYSIPSWSDVRIALRGMVVVTLLLVAGCALISIADELAPIALRGEVLSIMAVLKDALIDFVGVAIAGVSLVVFISLVGVVSIQVFPAVVGALIGRTIKSLRSRSGYDDEKSRPKGPASC